MSLSVTLRSFLCGGVSTAKTKSVPKAMSIVVVGWKTVEYMSSNHLSNNLIPYSKNSQGEAYGLAMSVTINPEMSGFMSSKSNFGWAGMASTYFRVDSEEKIIMISMA